MHFVDILNDLDIAGRLDDPIVRREFTVQLVEKLPLTPQQVQWLDVARRYARRLATSIEMAEARVSAWKALGTRSCEFSDPAVNRVRAVICTLVPDEDRQGEDGYEELHGVEEFFRAGGGDEAESVAVLNSVFGLPRRLSSSFSYNNH